jgi:hypothetical protein
VVETSTKRRMEGYVQIEIEIESEVGTEISAC